MSEGKMKRTSIFIDHALVERWTFPSLKLCAFRESKRSRSFSERACGKAIFRRCEKTGSGNQSSSHGV